MRHVAVTLAAGLALVMAATADARTPIEKQLDLRPGLQLAAMRTALRAAPAFFPGFDSHCQSTTPVLASVDGSVMAGNFRDDQAGCYVWLNLEQSPMLTAQEICKLALHEMGHLTGLQHSDDPNDVMYSPFASDPIPRPCLKPLPARASRRSRTSRRTRRSLSSRVHRSSAAG